MSLHQFNSGHDDILSLIGLKTYKSDARLLLLSAVMGNSELDV